MNDLDTLRRYDPAPASMYDDVAATRARARFEQIVATPPARVPEADVPRRRLALSALRLAAVGALVVGALIASIVLPDGRGTTPAFANWTAAPAAVPQSALDAIDRVCREAVAQTLTDPEVPSRDRLSPALGTPTLLVAEQRGDFGVAAYAGEGRAVPLLGETDAGAYLPSVLCLTHGPAGSPAVAQLSVFVPATSFGVTTWPAQRLPFELGWSVSGPMPANVAADDVELFSAGGGTMGDEGPFTILEGSVGDDVTGVVIHANGRDIEATVSGGHFLAWWPGGTKADWSPPARLPDVFRVTITLADGTVRHDVRPSGII